MSKRGRNKECNLCAARQALTEYLNTRLEKDELHIDLERNTNRDILFYLAGNRIRLYIEGKEESEFVQREQDISDKLFDVLLEIC